MTSGAGKFMMSITDATDPNLSRFLVLEEGKLLLFHGWTDPEGQAEPTVDYYKQVVQATFAGNLNAAREKVRLFLFPGMGHCNRGPGCNEADPLKALVDWVEKGIVPDYLVAEHHTNGIVTTSAASARIRNGPFIRVRQEARMTARTGWRQLHVPVKYSSLYVRREGEGYD